jgi:hypothetical protein
MTDRRKAVEANVSRNKCGVLQNEPNSTRSLWRPTTEVRAVTRHDGVRPLRPEIEFIDENGRAPSVGMRQRGRTGLTARSDDSVGAVYSTGITTEIPMAPTTVSRAPAIVSACPLS